MAGDVDEDTDAGVSDKLSDDGPGRDVSSTVLRSPAGDPSMDIIGWKQAGLVNN